MGRKECGALLPTQRHLGLPLSRVTPIPMLNVYFHFHSAGESSARERKNGTRYRDAAREGRGGTRGPPGAYPHTCFAFFVCVDQRDCRGDNQTSAKRNAELEKDPELREAEAVLAAANNGA